MDENSFLIVQVRLSIVMEEKQMNEQMLETFLNRRSIRSFTGEPVPMEKLNQIIMAGLSSASSRAARPGN
jgi:hypothetical protein